MKHGQVFKSDCSQAVRLAKAGALLDDVERVGIIGVGRTWLVTPASEMWDNWFYGSTRRPTLWVRVTSLRGARGFDQVYGRY